MNESLTSAEIAGWRAFYLVQRSPEAIKSLVDVEVEKKLDDAFGDSGRARWEAFYGR